MGCNKKALVALIGSVFIAGAGMAAALPGCVAALTTGTRSGSGRRGCGSAGSGIGTGATATGRACFSSRRGAAGVVRTLART